jgi:glutathione S-transferase
MTAPRLRLYAHPFSSYCQKALVALYENATPFDYRSLEQAGNNAELAALWPMKRFPVLADGERTVLEASCIIEYLQLHHPGPVRLIPDDPDAALEVRMLDRFFDNYVSTPQQKAVFDAIRAEADRDPCGVREARAMLETSYAWLDARMASRTWACGDGFSLADCAAPAAGVPAGQPSGRTRSTRASPRCTPIANGCWRGRRSSARWTRRGRTAAISRWARRIGIEAGRSASAAYRSSPSRTLTMKVSALPLRSLPFSTRTKNGMVPLPTTDQVFCTRW